jgi:hypothetical protein
MGQLSHVTTPPGRNFNHDPEIAYSRTAPPVNVVTGQDPFGTVLLLGAMA